MKYVIATGESYWVLETEVNKQMSLGYEPIGGVSISEGGDFFQAMVMSDKDGNQFRTKAV